MDFFGAPLVIEPSSEQALRQRQGPTAKDKATFVWWQRFLEVKRTGKLTKAGWEDTVREPFLP